ncbi:MAG: hypothetical protein EOP56_03120 [Sphingobacteriales bacterium]|nr:MAG: hypothetical protein EOP56_03120 [Sphingobacteriales bacterium]
MKTVEVFKTNVGAADAAKRVIALLHQHYPDSRITIDLEDCDKVLRIEGRNLIRNRVISVVSGTGHHCDMLE